MKHFADLTEEEKNVFADNLGEDLKKFFAEASEKYKLCYTCLHGAVITMCENFLYDMEQEDNVGTKH